MRAQRLVPLAALLLAGCAATSVQEVPMPDLSVRLSHPKRARLYIFRSASEDFAGYAALEVSIDEEPVGRLGPGRYLCVEVKPGLRSVQMFHDPTGQPTKSSIDVVEAKPGKVFYCEIRFPIEKSRWPQLVVLEIAEARRAMKALEPAPVEMAPEAPGE